MKGATQCVRRLKQLSRTLKKKHGSVTAPPVSDPIEQLILGLFSRNQPESKARDALRRLLEVVVDFNDLRVIPPLEMTETVGKIPDARIKCEDLSRALNRIFAERHAITLEHLRPMSKKDRLQYLSRIDGLDAYTRARIRLFGFEQHAIPLDEAMLAYARKCGIVDKTCTHEKAQAFLERQIADGDAAQFFAAYRKLAWAEMGAAVRRRSTEHIHSVPPDRSTRNMLRLVATGARDDGGARVEKVNKPAAAAKPDTTRAQPAATRKPRKKPTPKVASRTPAKKKPARASKRTAVKKSAAKSRSRASSKTARKARRGSARARSA